MYRPVPLLTFAMRAAALAAIVGGQSACVMWSPVVAPSRAANVAIGAAAFSTPTNGSAEPPRVVIRDYWGSPRASVVAWNDDEDWQGLRAAVRRDGTIPREHTLYFSAYSAPNVRAFYGANWFAFSDADVGGKQLQQYGLLTDSFHCQGKKGCSPYQTFQARVPDAVLRNVRDSLVVKVVGVDGHETEIAIRSSLIASYLATVDSVSAARKARTKASSQQ